MIRQVHGFRRIAGRGFLSGYHLLTRLRRKGFSALVAGGFAEFGRGSVLQPPVRLGGEHRIAVGDGVFVGPGSWLQTLGDAGDDVLLRIGDGTEIAGNCTLSAAVRIDIGRFVLLARNVYIADHAHAFEDPRRPVLEQGITGEAAVVIEDGAWLGQNVVVCPGVRIGSGAVIGANSVVRDDIPHHSVAVGAPARVVRTFASDEEVAR
jgi:acetyltransferase-like isoleucine patch superfamily enzyme